MRRTSDDASLVNSITEIGTKASDRVAGTFTATRPQLGGSTSKMITNGRLDMKFTGVTPGGGSP